MISTGYYPVQNLMPTDLVCKSAKVRIQFKSRSAFVGITGQCSPRIINTRRCPARYPRLRPQDLPPISPRLLPDQVDLLFEVFRSLNVVDDFDTLNESLDSNLDSIDMYHPKDRCADVCKSIYCPSTLPL